MANVLIGGVNLKTLGMHNGIANAKDYGALADDSYDNQGVVQSLIDAWEALDGGTIVFPASQEGARYRFTSGVINDSINVVSFSGTGSDPQKYTAGGNASVLWLDSDTDDASIIRYDSNSQTGGMIVERLLLMGNNDTDGLGANQSGVLFAGAATNHQIRECGFQYFSGYAVAHDPTSLVYVQNASIRNSHFWSVGGCFGPTQEYAAAANYLFATLYTLDNVGLDDGIGWSSWGHTPKPFIFDFRATRTVVCPGVFLIEGSGQSGMTAAIALASGSASFESIHYEITTNDPTYMFALYGVDGGYFNSSGEKTLKIVATGIEVGVPIWFENSATNESVVDIESLGSYLATSITDLFEWEDGINVNSSGYVLIGNLATKNHIAIPETYRGRVKILGQTGSDHQSRFLTSQNARLLMSWNASKGSLIGDWGDVIVSDPDSSIDSHAIEADGNFLCQRFTGDTTFFFPRLRFLIRGDNYEGASITMVYRHRWTVDAADSGTQVSIFATSDHIQQVEKTGTTDKNLATYSIGTVTGWLGDGIVDPNRWMLFAATGTAPTVPVVLRMIAVEIWLGQPNDVLLEPAKITEETATGTFTCSVNLQKTVINSSGGAVTATLPDGIEDGQRKKVTMSNATASSTLSVTSHETSDPEVFTFAQTTDVLILEWDSANAYWWTVKNIGVAT